MADSFAADLRKFMEKTKISMDKVVRKVTFDLFGEVVMRTPVDTGMARSNWQLGINERPTGIVDDAKRRINKQRNDKWGSYKTAKTVISAPMMANLSNVKAGGVNYIANNLPYIKQLEYGSSKQAPQGMAWITVQNFQRIVDEALRSL